MKSPPPPQKNQNNEIRIVDKGPSQLKKDINTVKIEQKR